MKTYWQLKVKRPEALEEVFDLRRRRKISVGDDAENDICVDSTLVPFQFPMLTMRRGLPQLKLTEEVHETLKGDFKKTKTWKERLYQGSLYEVNGSVQWKIGNTHFKLKEVDEIPLEGIRTSVDPEERRQFRQAVGYSTALYAILFLLFFFYGVIKSFFPSAPQELAVQRVTVVEAEKLFKKPIPAPQEITPSVVDIKPPEPPKVEEKIVAKKKAEKAKPATTNQKAMAKASQNLKSAAGKTGGAKPRNIKGMGLLAIQTTPGTSRVAMAVAAPQVVDRASDVNVTSLGLGKAAAGIGIGEGQPQKVARLGSISGSSYQGGLGDKLATSRTPSIALARKEVEVRGALDPAVIRQIIEERLPEIRYCYETALLKQTDLAGKISASWTIQPNGSVANIQSASDEIQQSVLHSCVKERITKWKFPTPKGGGLVHVKYPFLFNPVGGTQ